MSSRRALIVCVALAGLLVPSAAAIEVTISPGIGIGKITLGMTQRQVVRRLGTSHILNARDDAYTEWAWQFGAWTVGFRGGHVVQVATTVRAQQTSKRVGPGTSAARLVKAYPGGRCTHAVAFGSTTPLPSPTFWKSYGTEYLVAHKGGGQTIFVLHYKKIETPDEPFHSSNTQVVTEVYVRSAFRPLPEFGPDWPYRGTPADCAR
jgi:hypothetical protein